MKRKETILEGEIYHICNKSIANYGIFSQNNDVVRFIYTLEYYNNINNTTRFSYFLKTKEYEYDNLLITPAKSHVKFVAYCIMPDHYHLLLKILESDFSSFIANVENSYSRFFNTKYKRKGPLWQSRFRCVHIGTNQQLLHTSKYIHLNPTTAQLADKPEDWEYSSYKDYVYGDFLKKIKEISISKPKKYKEFAEDRINYQQKLKEIKNLLLE